jgi:bifunctional N-acetylglucosamine-1-phosphate-uridyltransferase/glucosamine-1-phosphate-acetyltransferase GlmU-like protein
MKILERIKIIPKRKTQEPKFQVLILKTKPAKNSFNGKILGRDLFDWVAFACSGMDISVVEYDGVNNIISFAKKHLNRNYDYTIILLSTTPIISSDTIQNIREYSSIKDISLCKLPVGYVAKNSYIMSAIEPQIDSLYSQNLEDFFLVENKKQFSQAEDILQDRINTFHIGNGVDIRKPKSVYIEPEVDIASGVVIFPGNSLKGQTIISYNVILKENNVIENSRIGEDSCISGSVVEESVLSHNVYISSFCHIKNSLIGDNSTIESGSKIYNYNLKSRSKIKCNTILGENGDSCSGAR